jgi:hypothetical protein
LALLTAGTEDEFGFTADESASVLKAAKAGLAPKAKLTAAEKAKHIAEQVEKALDFLAMHAGREIDAHMRKHCGWVVSVRAIEEDEAEELLEDEGSN